MIAPRLVDLIPLAQAPSEICLTTTHQETSTYALPVLTSIALRFPAPPFFSFSRARGAPVSDRAGGVPAALLSRREMVEGQGGDETVAPDVDGGAFAFVQLERTGLPVPSLRFTAPHPTPHVQPASRQRSTAQHAQHVPTSRKPCTHNPPAPARLARVGSLTSGQWTWAEMGGIRPDPPVTGPCCGCVAVTSALPAHSRPWLTAPHYQGPCCRPTGL